MSSMIELVVALLISVAALLAVAWPLLKKGPTPVLVEDDRLVELLHRKDQIMTSIKDLEFDYRVGKLDSQDYQLYDQRLRRQAIGVLQQIEKVAPEAARFDASLEETILRHRKVAPSTATAASIAVAAPQQHTGVVSKQANAQQLAATAMRPNADVRYCTNCGNQLAPHHKFCSNCGAPVESQDIVAAVESA